MTQLELEEALLDERVATFKKQLAGEKKHIQHKQMRLENLQERRAEVEALQIDMIEV